MTAYDDAVVRRIHLERAETEAAKLRGINSTIETRLKLREGPVQRWTEAGYFHQEHSWALDRIMAGYFAITRDVAPTTQRVEMLPGQGWVMALWKTDGAKAGNDPERMAAAAIEYTRWRDELRRTKIRRRPGTKWIKPLRALGEGRTLTEIARTANSDKNTAKLALRDVLDVYLDLRR